MNAALNEKGDRSPGSRNLNNIAMMIDFMPELLAAHACDIPAEDEITRGMRECVGKRKNSPTWFAFALQVFIDIQRIMGSEVGRG